MINLFLFLIAFFIIACIIDNYAYQRKSKGTVREGQHGVLNIDKRAALFILLLTLIPSIIVAFRSEETGVDTRQYLYHFEMGESYMRYRMASEGEYLFWSIFALCKKYLNVKAAFFIFCEMAIIPSFAAIYKLSKKANPFLVTFIFLILFYQECFNAMRQMPAIGLCFLALAYTIERKPLKFFFTVAVALLFHSSAIFFLPVYFMYSNRVHDRSRLFRRLLLCAAVIVAFPLMFSLFVTSYGSGRFADYSLEASTSLGWLWSFLISAFVFVIIYIVQKSINRTEFTDDDYKEIQFLWFTVFAYLVLNILRIYTNWVFRIGLFYELGGIILAGKLCNTKRPTYSANKMLINYKAVVVSVYYVLFFIHLNYFNNFDTSALVNFHLSI